MQPEPPKEKLKAGKAAAGALPVTVKIKNGPCVDCGHWDWSGIACMIGKRPDPADLSCEHVSE